MAISVAVSLLTTIPVLADVVKPALIEINVNRNGLVNIEIRASVEALLSGINGQYKQTQDSPFAEEYDELRVLPGAELAGRFSLFEPELLEQIWLKIGSSKLHLSLESIDIPAAGYTKVPRISVIRLTGRFTERAPNLQWYYPAKFGDSAVRVRQIDLQRERWHWSQWQWIREDRASEGFSLSEVAVSRSSLEVVGSYIALGFRHILPRGLDHLLFILGIFLLSTRIRPLFWQITMFTVAHSLTLGLSIAGIVELPARVVEPLIALSIAYIGLENLFLSKLTSRRLVLVFSFGLIHGLGFASVLGEFGMPADEFLTALISFNLGVEFAQLAVVGLGSLLVWCLFTDKSYYRKIVVIPCSLAISITGLIWFYDRLAI